MTWTRLSARTGQETVIQLQVKRFFCRNEACAKKTFGLGEAGIGRLPISQTLVLCH